MWVQITSLEDVHYKDIAPFIGLEPYHNMKDIKTFCLCRSCIPTTLFKSIVQDIDVMLVQHGPVIKHDTEEVTSWFLSPVSASNSSDHQKTQTCNGRSLTTLLLYLALLLGTCLSLPSRVVPPPKTG